MSKYLIALVGIFFIAGALAFEITQNLTVNVLPSRVAYIYVNEKKIDQNIINAFGDP